MLVPKGCASWVAGFIRSANSRLLPPQGVVGWSCSATDGPGAPPDPADFGGVHWRLRFEVVEIMGVVPVAVVVESSVMDGEEAGNIVKVEVLPTRGVVARARGCLPCEGRGD